MGYVQVIYRIYTGVRAGIILHGCILHKGKHRRSMVAPQYGNPVFIVWKALFPVMCLTGIPVRNQDTDRFSVTIRSGNVSGSDSISTIEHILSVREIRYSYNAHIIALF